MDQLPISPEEYNLVCDAHRSLRESFGETLKREEKLLSKIDSVESNFNRVKYLAKDLAWVHIGDRDELGSIARELLEVLGEIDQTDEQRNDT